MMVPSTSIEVSEKVMRDNIELLDEGEYVNEAFGAACTVKEADEFDV
jgi:hypothetical protein